MSLNISILISSFKYLKEYKLLATLNIWIYDELAPQLYKHNKLTTALSKEHFDIIESLNSKFKTKKPINQFINNCIVEEIKISDKLFYAIAAKYIINKNRKYETLIWAAMNGFLELVILSIELGANVHFRKEEPLRQAIDNNQEKVIEYLVKHDIYACFDSVLNDAAKYNNFKVVKAIIDADAKIFCYDEALYVTSDPDIIELLISKGARKEYGKSYKLIKAARNNDKHKIQTLLDSGFNINIGGGIALVEAFNDYVHYENPDLMPMVKFLVKKGINIHVQNDQLLVAACAYNDYEFVKYLLEHGANIHAQIDRPFRIACQLHCKSIASLLLQQKFDYKVALDFCCENGDVATFVLLQCKEQDSYKFLKKAILNENFPVATYILDNYDRKLKDTMLIRACKLDNKHIVKFLLSQGLDVHVGNDKPLRIASNKIFNIKIIKRLVRACADITKIDYKKMIDRICTFTDYDRYIFEFETINFLIDYGFDITAYDNKLFKSLWCTDNNVYELDSIKLFLDNGIDVHIDNDKVLINACSNFTEDANDLIYLLIDYGADVSADNSKALRNICCSNDYNIDIVRLFLEQGADIHACDNEALFNAVSNNSSSLVEFLLTNGADIHARNDTILTEVYQRVNPETIKLLIEHGAVVHNQDIWNNIVERTSEMYCMD